MNLSIITPAYNAENFIETMIISVLRQPKVVELIIVDDGSIDRTADIVKAYATEYSNIHLIQTENRGAGAARNTGIKSATSDWIIFLDADDMLLPNSINLNFQETLNCYDNDDINVIYTTRSRTNLDLSSTVQISYPEKIEQIKNHMPLNEFWTCIYRREYLVNCDIYFSEYKAQDIETAYRFKAFSRTEQIVADSDIKFYLQRINPTSNIHTWNILKMYSIKACVYNDLLDETLKKSYFATDNDIAYLKYVVFHCLYHYFKNIKANGYDSSLPEEQLQGMIMLWKQRGKLSIKEISNLRFHDAALYCIRKINSIKYGITKSYFSDKIKRVDCKNNKIKEAAVFPDKNMVIDRWVELVSCQGQ